MQVPETRYARTADGLRLAYQQWGEGPPLLVVPALLSNTEVGWEHERYRRALEYMGRHFEVVHFDKRGIGLSDRPEELPTLTQRLDDLLAVMDHVGWTRAHVLAISEGGIMGQLFAAEHPERIDRLVLVSTAVPGRYRHQTDEFAYPGDLASSLAEMLDRFVELTAGWPENPEYFVEWFMPDQAGDESFVRWMGRLMRLSASPRDFERQVQSVLTLDAGDAPERIVAPTLVMHVTGDRVLPVAGGRQLAHLIAGAEYVEIDGEDHFQWVMDNWRDVGDRIVAFCTGRTPERTVTRRFSAVLFTDIVDSTRLAAAAGDSAWRELLDRHDTIARRLVDGHGGRVVKSTGDGLLVTFDVPAQAVSCGQELVGRLAAMDLPIRAGVHAGEIELHDDGDISGIAVNLAARVEQAAADGELWASSTVRDMMLGGSGTFDDRGEHQLKGIDGTWRLFAVS